MSNFVLVLPDPQVETYQIAGKELGLIAPDFKYEKGEKISIKERNLSVMGTVYSVPDSLRFNLTEIDSLKKNSCFAIIDGTAVPINISIHRHIAQETADSVLYDVDMEVEKGDRVMFTYLAHKKAKDERMVVETDFGEMYLIKYDMLQMVLGEENKPKKMLNGYLLVEPEEIDILREDGKEFIEHSSGLVTIAPKFKLKKTKKNQIGKILLAGTRCRGYLQHKEKTDCTQVLNLNEKIVYDPRLCQKLEFETHQIISDKILHLIQRKDIHFICEEGFDFKQLSLEKRRLVNV